MSSVRKKSDSSSTVSSTEDCEKQDPPKDEVKMSETLFNRLRGFGLKSKFQRNVLSEFVGTFLLVFIGTCIVAQFHLLHEKYTTFLGVNIGWGFAIMLAVMATANLSGGHLNPAISLLMWSIGHLPLSWVFAYSAAQIAGSFVAAGCMYGYYYDFFTAFDGGLRAVSGATGTGTVFCSYPNAALTGSFIPYVDQIINTGILCYFLCVVIDDRNKIPKVWHPLFFGFLVMMIGTGFAMHTGYPMNPARDLGPRLFSLFVYGTAAFTTPYSSYFLVPIIGPCLGALFGGWFYQISLGMHLPEPEGEEAKETDEQKKLMA